VYCGRVGKLQRDRERAMKAWPFARDTASPVSILPILTRVPWVESQRHGARPRCPAPNPRDASPWTFPVSEAGRPMLLGRVWTSPIRTLAREGARWSRHQQARRGCSKSIGRPPTGSITSGSAAPVGAASLASWLLVARLPRVAAAGLQIRRVGAGLQVPLQQDGAGSELPKGSRPPGRHDLSGQPLLGAHADMEPSDAAWRRGSLSPIWGQGQRDQRPRHRRAREHGVVHWRGPSGRHDDREERIRKGYEAKWV
jgi:hypothetical protein